MMNQVPYLNIGNASLFLYLMYVHLTSFHALSIHRHFPFFNANNGNVGDGELVHMGSTL